MKVYIVDVKEYRSIVEGSKMPENPLELSDKDFIDFAENTGWVLTLQEFQEEFNGESIVGHRDMHYLRFIGEYKADYWRGRYEAQRELLQAHKERVYELKEEAGEVLSKFQKFANKNKINTY